MECLEFSLFCTSYFSIGSVKTRVGEVGGCWSLKNVTMFWIVETVWLDEPIGAVAKLLLALNTGCVLIPYQGNYLEELLVIAPGLGLCPCEIYVYKIPL